MKCGKPVSNEWQEYCADCEHTHHYYEKGIALWLHKEAVKQSIYHFKFHNQRAFAKYYAEEMVRNLGTIVKRWNPELLIPIPLHMRKQRKRGYNQAALLARELGKRLNVEVDEKVLIRKKYTKPQKELGPENRKKNLETAFAIKDKEAKKRLQGKKVLLIDDIYTTGSTIDAAARILKNGGAQNVCYLTISIGQGY